MLLAAAFIACVLIIAIEVSGSITTKALKIMDGSVSIGKLKETSSDVFVGKHEVKAEKLNYCV